MLFDLFVYAVERNSLYLLLPTPAASKNVELIVALLVSSFTLAPCLTNTPPLTDFYVQLHNIYRLTITVAQLLHDENMTYLLSSLKHR